MCRLNATTNTPDRGSLELSAGLLWQIVHVAADGRESILAPCLESDQAAEYVATYNADVAPMRGGDAEPRKHFANRDPWARVVLPASRRATVNGACSPS